jgi:putative membrane protein
MITPHSNKHWVYVILITGAAWLAAMAQEQEVERKKEVREDGLRQTNGLPPAHFVEEAAWSSLKEIRLGALAEQRAEKSEVREFGRRMVTDHSAANTRLAEIARSKGITFPTTNAFEGTNADRKFVRDREQSITTTDRQAELNAPDGRLDGREMRRDVLSMKHHDVQAVQRLQRLSGSEFDRAYVREMVKDHTHAVESFQHASLALTDGELKTFATETLPKLREHKEMAEKLAGQMGINPDDKEGRDLERRQK